MNNEGEQSFEVFTKNDLASIMYYKSLQLITVKLTIKFNECDCMDFENKCINNLDIKITHGKNLKIKLQKTTKNLTLSTGNVCVDLYNLKECITNSIEINGKIKTEGSSDLILPSVQYLQMELTEDSTIQFSNSFEMKKMCVERKYH